MTAKELIEELQELPPDVPIFFGEGINNDTPSFPACSIKMFSFEDAMYSNNSAHANIIRESYDLSPDDRVAIIMDTI